MSQLSNGTANPTSPVPSRDGLISDLPQISTLVNLLQQAATGAASGTSGMQLTVPPDAPMPAPKAAPAVPTTTTVRAMSFSPIALRTGHSFTKFGSHTRLNA